MTQQTSRWQTRATTANERTCSRRAGSPAAGQRSLTGRSVRPNAGFTLIEMLVAVAITSVLSMIAIPSFQSQVQRVRRSDAVVAMIQIQLAESRWRANGASYGSLSEIGVRSVSGSGHYGLRLGSDSPDSYQIVATAQGAQASDAGCRVFVLDVTGGEITRTSGPDATTRNDAASNRRCWGL